MANEIDELREVLQKVSAGLEPGVFEDSYDYYMNLYGEDWGEGSVAETAIQHPELYPLMQEVVLKIIARLSGGDAYSIWVHDEEQAGSPLTRALALEDKQYCELFARLLLEQDLDHEVYQNDYITEILDKWGNCEETTAILLARAGNPGQWGPELLEELAQAGRLPAEIMELPEDEE